MERIRLLFRKIVALLYSKWIIRIVYIPTAFALLFVWYSNNRIIAATTAQCFDDVQKIEAHHVGLLLGTSKYAKGGENLFFKYRIEAAAQLFHQKKIEHIIVSGDNHIAYYNEPEEMRKALIAKGVPDSCITLDYAGFRTLDSVVRCEKVFGQKQFTIISQRFHNERALYIAQQSGLHCVAFNAKDVPGNYGLKTAVREYFARAKCLLDMHVLHTQPKFLGKKIKV